MKKIWIFLSILALSAIPTLAQAKRKPKPKPKPKTANTKIVPTQTAPEIISPPVESVNVPPKKNERIESSPDAETAVPPAKKNNPRETPKPKTAAAMPFAYEFSQPDFVVSRVVIEHDANGKGKITFEKKDLGEPVTDPLEISAAVLERIKGYWTELNFLDSTENYQSEKYDYPHLGVMKLRRTEGEKKREATLNWTENEAAKKLTEEYKKLTEQFVWMFEINVARENLPLNSPQLVDRLVGLYNRKWLSDPKQMLPFLRELADDERLPLVARNQTAKLIQRIEKQKD